MEAGADGVLAVVETRELPGGSAIYDHPALGLLLVGQGRVVAIRDGSRLDLQLEQGFFPGIDTKGDETKGIDRIKGLDVDGDGIDELLTVDDDIHRVAVYDSQNGEALEPLIAWQVWDDTKYPYGDGQGQKKGRAEPRLIRAADLDGDGHAELVLLCHDRLLVYMGREEEVQP